MVSWGLWLEWAPAASAVARCLCLLGLTGLLLVRVVETFPVGRAIVGAVAGGVAIGVLAVAVGLPNYGSSGTPQYRLLLRELLGRDRRAVRGAPGRRLLAAVGTVAARRRFRALTAAPLAVVCGADCLPPDGVAGGRIPDLVVRTVRLACVRAARSSCVRGHRVSGPGAKRRVARERWPLLPPLAIGCGSSLALASFYSSTSVWIYFPIPLVLGFVLLNWFLLVPPAHSHTARASPPAGRRWPNCANLRRLERTSAAMRNGRDKLAKGEIGGRIQENSAP